MYYLRIPCHVFDVSTSPVTLLGSQFFTAIATHPGSILDSTDFIAGSLVGCPPCTFFGSSKRCVRGSVDILFGVCFMILYLPDLAKRVEVCLEGTWEPVHSPDPDL